MNHRDTCVSCDAPLLWAKTRAGKMMPLDAEPNDPKGNIRLIEGGSCEVAKNVDLEDMGKLYTSHFATCPGAAAHRKRTS